MPSAPTQAGAGRPGAAPPDEPIEILTLEFGDYPEIVPLNRRFRPDHRLLKMTIDVHAGSVSPTLAAGAASWLAALQRMLPSLARHTCCGDGRLAETLFVRGRRSADPSDPSDDPVDLAHLLEHLIIDFQHHVADMRLCSGVTCGYRDPVSRFDVFVESPDDRVSRLCAALAGDLANGLARGGSPDPFYAKVVRLARHAYLGRGDCVTPAAAAAALGNDPQSLSALMALAELGFLREIDASMNFSGAPIYTIAPEEPDRP